MALIPGASNWLTKGINEAYGLAATGMSGPKNGNYGGLTGAYQKFKRDLAKGKEVAGGFYDNNIAIKSASASDGGGEVAGASTDKGSVMLGPDNKPRDINSQSSGGGSNSDGKIINAIGRGWDDAGDVISDTKKSLGSSQNYINNLGKVRDQYLKSIDNYKKKTDDAIVGNKTLIEQNQKKDLDVLAGDTRKSMDNTNVMLGVKGASGGSASRAAARAIAQSAGKQRAKTLTAYGDETSKQNLASKNAAEEYATKREQAYEWEKTSRQQAMDDYNAQKKALDRLSSKKSGWKDADIKAASDKNLNNLMGSLNAIMVQAKNFRDNLANKMSEYGGLADELDSASVAVDAPAELDTPVFNENIDLTDPNNAEDWYDPKNTGKRVIKGYDALGNPIFEDAPIVEEPAV